LPSKDELELMYKNLRKAGFGSFASILYWSSSENYSKNAWSHNYMTGYQYNGYNKDETFSVRAVRAF